MSAQLRHGLCDECDDPVAVGSMGWYRCRSCGHESLRQHQETEASASVRAPQARARMGLSLSPTKRTER